MTFEDACLTAGKFAQLLEEKKAKYYIQSGLGASIIGGDQIPSNLDDIDIRVKADIWEVFQAIQEKADELGIKGLRMRDPIVHDRYVLKSNCIEFTATVQIDKSELEVDFDITSEMESEVHDIGTIVFPVTDEWFDESRNVEVAGVNLCVANEYVLMTYYLVLRRDVYDGKDDYLNMRLLTTYTDFDMVYYLHSFLPKHFSQEIVDKLTDLYQQMMEP